MHLSTRLRRGAALGCAAAVVLTTGAPATASVGAVVHAVTTCTTTPTASVSAAPDGWVRGFVETGCAGDVIAYVTDIPAHSRWIARATPYRGQVLASAQDAQATYLLYRASDGVRVTKVLRSGLSTPGVLLSAAVGGGLEGTISVRGGTWYAMWTEPKASGGFALHAAASRNFVISPKDRVLPAGSGVDDSAPALGRGSGQHMLFVLAFSRHTSSGYHLELSQWGRPWHTPRVLDSGQENPAAALLRDASGTYLAWMHGRTVRLATTAGTGVLHALTLPQAPGSGPVGNPRVAYSCGRLFVAFQADGESSGRVYVDTLFKGHWVQHLVRVSQSSAPSLTGIAPHCSAAVVTWTEAGGLYAATVA